MYKKIENFVLPEHHNKLYTEEAISSISLTREVANKINEIINALNTFSDDDTLWKHEQEGRIRKGVVFMKDNLINSLNELFDILFGKDDSALVEMVDRKYDGYINKIKESLAYFVTPDKYEGTDTQKIQLALDKLKNTGGTIVLNRQYEITANVVNKLRTDATRKNITFIGLGENAGFKFNGGYFSCESYADCGGLNFINCYFTGKGKAFNTTHLVRCHFSQCYFQNLDFVFYVETIIQSCYFNQCSFKDIKDSTFYLLGATHDVKISQCKCEASKNFFLHDPKGLNNGLFNCSITDSCIEGLSGYGIRLSVVYNMTITNNYFEQNYCSISAYRCNYACYGLVIENNHFFDTVANRVSIHLPTSCTDIIGSIRNNNIHNNGILYSCESGNIECFLENNRAGENALLTDGTPFQIRDRKPRFLEYKVSGLSCQANELKDICSLSEFAGFNSGYTIMGLIVNNLTCANTSSYEIAQPIHINYSSGKVQFIPKTTSKYDVYLTLVVK